ncbi:MAG: BREX system ATP-binding domain-containing protein [Actinomycetota bacterium]
MSIALDPRVMSRRAIEAMRSGVPSRESVAALGSAQSEIEDRFTAILEALRALPAGGHHPGGMLIGGNFGSGKSHLLEHLAHLGLDAGFVVSKVVISKETSLHDPAKVFRAAVEGAVVPGRRGSALPEVAASLRTDSPAYTELYRWVHSHGCGLNERFAATLFLFERLRARDEEFAELIVRFWAGDPIRVPDLRRRLRETGEAATYPLPPVIQRDLAIQRFRFASRLMRAAGHAGWIVIFDEVELIGRYSVLQRAKSYAELARWIRGSHEDPGVPLAAVMAITSDFESAVISAKNDYEMVPARLRSRQSAEYDFLAGQAEVGMRVIDRELVLLRPPDKAELDRTYRRLKEMHAEAFGWDPPDVSGLERLGATQMRQYVRAWINEWDLVRLDPGFVPETETVEIALDYREDADLDGAAP